MSTYNIIASTNEATVITEYECKKQTVDLLGFDTIII